MEHNEPVDSLTIEIDCCNLDVATKKANRLVELLREVSSIISSLPSKKD